MRLRTSVAPLVLVLAAAGCSLPQSATPDGGPGPSVQPSDPAQPSAAPTALSAIEACELLTVEEASYLDVPPQGHPEEIVGLRSCNWVSPGGGGLSTTIDGDLGIGELVLNDASAVTDITIGDHQAKRAEETSGPGYCGVYFAVGDSANVSVTALYLNDTPQACAVADQAAALVEPKLP